MSLPEITSTNGNNTWTNGNDTWTNGATIKFSQSSSRSCSVGAYLVSLER